MKAVIVLAVLCAIACADHEEGHHEEGHHGGHEHAAGHHHHHGSVCSLPTEQLRTVVTCVEGKVDPEVLRKLNAVAQQLQCENIFCGIQKFCERDGTLENNRTDVFTADQNQQLRVAFHDCRPEHHSTEAAHPEATEAAPHE
uniref:Putative his-rich 1 n=1 Tax=Amblyomma parvum TaxID=251391 RepID=A0A023FYI7_AMBPA